MDLGAKPRAVTGKKVKALREEGLIPAELYGHGVPNAHLAVAVKEFNKVFKEAGTNTIVTILLEKEKKPVIIQDVGYDPVSGDVLSVDFYQVKMTEKLTARIPLEFIGEAPAVKEKGAVLTKAMTDVEVEALPQDLPHRLTVDLSSLNDLDKSIYVRDLKLPKGVEVTIDKDAAIVTANPPAKEEVVEAPVDVSAVKVESEEKKAERAAEKTEPGSAEKAGGKPDTK